MGSIDAEQEFCRQSPLKPKEDPLDFVLENHQLTKSTEVSIEETLCTVYRSERDFFVTVGK